MGADLFTRCTQLYEADPGKWRCVWEEGHAGDCTWDYVLRGVSRSIVDGTYGGPGVKPPPKVSAEP